jgi:2,4-dienoyl-CoA reductase-like NADH-dependent reductase (Old Yellow Enzyme family)
MYLRGGGVSREVPAATEETPAVTTRAAEVLSRPFTLGRATVPNRLRGFAGESAAVATLDDLLDRLERDEFDFVAVGRALLGDPAWAAKILGGKVDELLSFAQEQLRVLS